MTAENAEAKTVEAETAGAAEERRVRRTGRSCQHSSGLSHGGMRKTIRVDEGDSLRTACFVSSTSSIDCAQSEGTDGRIRQQEWEGTSSIVSRGKEGTLFSLPDLSLSLSLFSAAGQ